VMQRSTPRAYDAMPKFSLSAAGIQLN
jgi:hypothetical protein